MTAPSVCASRRRRGCDVVVPRLPTGTTRRRGGASRSKRCCSVDAPRAASRISSAWYYTPMALPFTRQLTPAAVVYDCMDELSAFAGAPPELRTLERELLARADVVFTGGQQPVRGQARRGIPTCTRFPAASTPRTSPGARDVRPSPTDQAPIPRPRMGFCGVIDERMDLSLLAAVAAAAARLAPGAAGPGGEDRPGARCPSRPNMHYLGMKPYAELPDVHGGLGRGDVAVRAQRRHPVHQPDQDARVSGGRAAGGLHLDPRRGRALRNAAAWRGSPTTPAHSSPRSRRRSPTDALRAVQRRRTRSSAGLSWDRTARGCRS